MSSPQPFKVAIAGYGLSAKIFHIPFILALPASFTLYGIVQRTPTPQNDAKADHPHIKTWTSTTNMLQDAAVDLVIVGTPLPTHVSICRAALLADKHVLCEKPFTRTSADARELAQLATTQKKVLAVYQNRRWDADFVTVQSLLASPENVLGRIVEFETHFDRHRPVPPTGDAVTWKATPESGGAVYDLGSHLLDQAVVLFGMPGRVTGFVGNQRVYGEEGTGEDAGGDSFTVLLHYEGRGLLVTAKAGVVSAEERQLRYWVRGEKGSFRKYGLDVQEDQLRAGKRPDGEAGKESDYGVEAEDYNGVLTEWNADTKQMSTRRVEPKSPPETYVAFYSLLAKAMAGEGPNPVSAEDGVKVIRLIELAIESSKQGRTLDV